MITSDIIAIVYPELLKVVGGVTVILAALFAFLGKTWLERISRKENELRDTKIAELNAQLVRQGR